MTDYFFIDGYKRIKQAYLSKPDKIKLLFPKDNLCEQVMRIFVFPNIEFRLKRNEKKPSDDEAVNKD